MDFKDNYDTNKQDDSSRVNIGPSISSNEEEEEYGSTSADISSGLKNVNFFNNEVLGYNNTGCGEEESIECMEDAIIYCEGRTVLLYFANDRQYNYFSGIYSLNVFVLKTIESQRTFVYIQTPYGYQDQYDSDTIYHYTLDYKPILDLDSKYYDVFGTSSGQMLLLSLIKNKINNRFEENCCEKSAMHIIVPKTNVTKRNEMLFLNSHTKSLNNIGVNSEMNNFIKKCIYNDNTQKYVSHLEEMNDDSYNKFIDSLSKNEEYRNLLDVIPGGSKFIDAVKKSDVNKAFDQFLRSLSSMISEDESIVLHTRLYQGKKFRRLVKELMKKMYDKNLFIKNINKYLRGISTIELSCISKQFNGTMCPIIFNFVQNCKFIEYREDWYEMDAKDDLLFPGFFEEERKRKANVRSVVKLVENGRNKRVVKRARTNFNRHESDLNQVLCNNNNNSNNTNNNNNSRENGTSPSESPASYESYTCTYSTGDYIRQSNNECVPPSSNLTKNDNESLTGEGVVEGGYNNCGININAICPGLDSSNYIQIGQNPSPRSLDSLDSTYFGQNQIETQNDIFINRQEGIETNLNHNENRHCMSDPAMLPFMERQKGDTHVLDNIFRTMGDMNINFDLCVNSPIMSKRPPCATDMSNVKTSETSGKDEISTPKKSFYESSSF